MAVATRKSAPPSLELKSAVLTLTALSVTDVDLAPLAAELARQTAELPGLFDHDPVLLDLAAVAEAAEGLDLAALVALLREHRLLPVAVRGGHPDQHAAAQALGLAVAAEAPAPAARTVEAAAPAEPVSEPEAVATPEPSPTEVATAALDAALAGDPAAAVPPATVPTLVIDRPLRSGQQVYARGGDLVVLAIVSHGAEVIADGSIHVYAPLRGKAIAGARGDAGARIFSTCMEPQLISVAGTYRTLETDLPAEVRGRPAQVRLDGERLVVEPLAVPVAPPAARGGRG